jgi:hypothetical protein
MNDSIFRFRRLGQVFVSIAAGGVALLGSSAFAQVPGTITHQGRLYDSNDAPLDTQLTLTFTIYDAAAGGTELWTESHDVTFENGYFSVQLGARTPRSTRRSSTARPGTSASRSRTIRR